MLYFLRGGYKNPSTLQPRGSEWSEIGTSVVDTPRLRQHFELTVDAADLAALVGVLHYLADEIELGGRETRVLTSRGTTAEYRAVLRPADGAAGGLSTKP